MAQSPMDQVVQDLGEKTVDNMRKWQGNNNNNNNNYNQNKRQEVARVYTAGPTDKGKYAGNLPHCKPLPEKQIKETKTTRGTHLPAMVVDKKGHYKNECPKVGKQGRGNQIRGNQNRGNQNQGNQNGGKNGQGNQNRNGARGRVYALGEAAAVQDNNVVTGTFLINNHYASVLFDSSADRSFASTTFSEYLNVIPTTLDTKYHVELADRNIHKYIEKGCPMFLIQVTEKETGEKQLRDLPIVRDFLEVFPEDFPGLTPACQVEFQIDLVPRAAPVAHAPYRLAPAEMKELSDQLKNCRQNN
ncbi:hypothetical protein Tco_0663294 [Tanacetum coccineum]